MLSIQVLSLLQKYFRISDRTSFFHRQKNLQYLLGIENGGYTINEHFYFLLIRHYWLISADVYKVPTGSGRGKPYLYKTFFSVQI